MRIENMDSHAWSATGLKAPDIKLDVIKHENTEQIVKEAEIQEKISLPFLEKAVSKANQAMFMQNRQLQFSIHEKTKEIMVKIVDSETKEVIREIPPEKLLDMFASMLEFAGLLVDERR
ncbi:MAG: flagellar protein FlaG [Clostridiaceae bacterium]|nr:flagellar protein FlaG [Clostridiaceae bacterium]